MGRWLHKPWPRTGNNTERPVFIVGSGRSGTTLMRRMLMSGGQVHIPPESYVLGSLCRRHVVAKWLPWDEYVRWVLGRFQLHPGFAHWHLDLRPLASRLHSGSLQSVIGAVYREHMAVHAGRDDLQWGDKTPMNTERLGWIDRTFPDARYVEMVRDGADVVASAVQSGMESSVQAAARRWVSAVEAVARLRQRAQDRVITVRYEDLVADPDSELQRVSAFLGVSVSADKIPKVDLGDVHLAHLRRVTAPVNMSSVGTGRRAFADRGQDLSGILDRTLVELGYRPIG